jgi:hypothetical protein
VQAELEGLRHDRAFEGEEDEGEAGVDDRGQRRAEIAESGATGEQVHVDGILRRVVGDRDAGGEDDDRGDADRDDGAGEAVGDGYRAADGEVGQVGDAAERRSRDDIRAPAAEGLGRIAQRVVLERVVLGPAVIGATRLD